MFNIFDAAQQWIDQDVDGQDQAELAALVERGRTEVPHGGPALAELWDRFAGTLQFGTAGLRGAMAAGPNRMNRAVVIGAAAGLGNYLLGAIGEIDPDGDAPLVVVGCDARHRSSDFALDTARVLTAQGIRVRLLPLALPTPVLAFATRHWGADAGVMVTASHNPAADNGYKVYLGGRVVTDWGQGAQIVPPYDALIAAEIAKIGAANAVPRAEFGWADAECTPEIAGIVDAYVAAVLSASASQGGGVVSVAPSLRIVTTSMHGVGGDTLARVLAEAGFDDVHPVAEQRDPDPDFPTVAFPNPEEKGAIDLAIAKAVEVGADVVLANDPDADRCAAAVPDPRAEGGWRMLHGDEVGALLGSEAAKKVVEPVPEPVEEVETTNQSPKVSTPSTGSTSSAPTLANSVVSSRLLAAIAAKSGLAHATTLTGFKWISRAPGLVFGYEEALGYCVEPGIVRDKDGISAALWIAQMAARLKAESLLETTAGVSADVNGCPSPIINYLDGLAREHGLYLTDQLSARFTDLSGIPEAMARLRAEPPTMLGGSPVVSVDDLADGVDGLPPTDGVRLLTADNTRVIVRPSGTEPKVKCYLEVIRHVAPEATFDDVTSVRTDARAALETLKQEMKAALGL